MIFSLNASSARLQSSNTIIIYNEISEIFKKILAEIHNGEYEAIVKNTYMTESTPKITITGTIENPTILPNDTININGTNIILGITGTNLNSIIADINDTNISGLIASKNENKLVIEYTVQENNWQLNIGAGSANAVLGLASQIYVPENPDSVDYYSVWTEVSNNRKLKSEMDMIIKYFESLGYTIYRKTNINTANTFEWVIQW